MTIKYEIINNKILLYILFLIGFILFILYNNTVSKIENFQSQILSHKKLFYINTNETPKKISNKLKDLTLTYNISNNDKSIYSTHYKIWKYQIDMNIPYIIVCKNILPEDNIFDELDNCMTSLNVITTNIIFLNISGIHKNKYTNKNLLNNEFFAYHVTNSMIDNILSKQEDNLTRSYVLTLNGAKRLVHKSHTNVYNDNINKFMILNLNKNKSLVLETKK